VHAVSAMLAGGVGRDSTVVGFAKNRAGICGGGRYRTKDVRCGWLFS
jgi:hypothetical protein